MKSRGWRRRFAALPDARSFVAAVVLLWAGTAGAQDRDRCNWCGCKGSPGYRVGANVESGNQRLIGQCVSHRDLNIVCGTPPTTHCTYEGNRERPGGLPPNVAVDRSTGRRAVPRPDAPPMPALTE
jgi:hypothetical protein